MLSRVKTKRGSGVIMCENKKGEWCYCVKIKRGSGVIMCENKKGAWCYHV